MRYSHSQIKEQSCTGLEPVKAGFDYRLKLVLELYFSLCQTILYFGYGQDDIEKILEIDR